MGSNGNLTFWDDEPVIDQLNALAGDNPLPFFPIEKIETFIDQDSGRTYSRHYFACKNLLPSGRCGDYENRPDLCRKFDPASDALCVHYQGAEGTGDGL